jgi:polar amino acid transport system substrate-binding protein
MTETVFAYIDEPPFAFPQSGTWPGGCDAELARAVLNAMGVKNAASRLVTFAELLDGVARHLWTFNTGIFVSDERKEHVRFSKPIWGLSDGLMTARKNAERFKTYEQIAGDASARLAVVEGQVQAATAKRAGIPAERIDAFETPEQAIAALRAGKISAYASVAMAHRGLLERRPDPALAFSNLGAPEFAGRAGSAPALGAFSFAKDGGTFADEFDAALRRFLGSPEHVQLASRYGFRVKDGVALA